MIFLNADIFAAIIATFFFMDTENTGDPAGKII
jgi:hypothetical protein